MDDVRKTVPVGELLVYAVRAYETEMGF